MEALKSAMTASAAKIEAQLDALIPRAEGPEARVMDAMRYASLDGGKRLRPFLVLTTAALFDVPEEYALRAGAAVEFIHCYSLVHDDLPAMDDDDLRRGKPTTHKAFDEATAILAGDGLLTLAFEVLADPATHPDAEVRCRLAGALSAAAGATGMVGGQMFDLEAEKDGRRFTLEDVTNLQRMKTGALIRFGCLAGPILGRAGDEAHAALDRYARDIGLAFQIADDILDATGDETQVGKKVGKDAAAGKATFISFLGIDGARKRAAELAESAGDAVSIFGEKAQTLVDTARFIVERKA